MLSFYDLGRSLDPLHRREWLRVGGLSVMGLSLPTLLGSRAVKAAPVLPANPLSGDLGATFGRAKNVIFLWLQGGPPQHETFDPKPDAPLEIRGPFKPIHTNVPGVEFSELLPRTSRYADQMAVVRSLTVRDLNPPLGVRALLGAETDDGFEFDFTQDRLMLDTRTLIGKYQGGGFGPTVQLDDGTLVTSYSYRGDDDKTHLEVVRWKAPPLP